MDSFLLTHPKRIEELIAAGAFPEKSREICAGILGKGASTATPSSHTC